MRPTWPEFPDAYISQTWPLIPTALKRAVCFFRYVLQGTPAWSASTAESRCPDAIKPHSGPLLRDDPWTNSQPTLKNGPDSGPESGLSGPACREADPSRGAGPRGQRVLPTRIKWKGRRKDSGGYTKLVATAGEQMWNNYNNTPTNWKAI